MEKVQISSLGDAEKEVGGPFVLEFKAEWCGPCRQMEPLFSEVSEEYDIPGICVDVDDHLELASEIGVSSVPSFVAVEQGEIREYRTGAQSKDELRELFDLLVPEG